MNHVARALIFEMYQTLKISGRLIYLVVTYIVVVT